MVPGKDRKGLRGRFLVAAMTLALLVVAVGAEAKPRVAVLDFQDNSGSGAPAKAITDMMTTELFNTGMFTVVERSRMDALATEQRLAGQGLADSTTAVQMGKVLGVDYLLTGSVTQYKYEASGGVIPLPFGNFSGVAVGSETAYVTLDVRMINAQTGEVLLTAKEEGAANQSQGGLAYDWAVFGTGKAGGILGQATYKAVTKVVTKLKTQTAMRGGGDVYNVLAEAAKTVTLDAGAVNAGAQVGQLYLVYAEGKAVLGIKGEILDVEKVTLALVKLTDVQPKYSRGEIVKGVDVRRGDKAVPFHGDPETVKIGIR
ncbi:CsgG/HfaB family protein [Aminomonas paucivorans]|uniref:CsgG/HfaB family protein n=1 Tax=Aminomonas paucivorans TaxID=81412 RepID=UPI00331ECE7B